jgi:hypothetical protein
MGGAVGWVGQIYFCDMCYRVFELPSPRNAQKRDKTKPRKNQFWIFGRIFVKTFRHDVFCFAFELSSLRNTRKRDKTKENRGKLTSKCLLVFVGKVFDIDFVQKYFNVVFAPHETRSRRAEQREGAERKEPRPQEGGRDDDGREAQRGRYWHGGGALRRR